MRLLTLLAIVSTPAFADILLNGKPSSDRPPEHFSGEVTYREDDKKVRTREQYVDGHREGPYVEYDVRTGKITDSGTYHNGKYQGVRRHFSDDGVIQMELSYSDSGEQVGVQKMYENGVVSRVYLMVAGNNMPDVDFQLTKKGQLSTLSCGTRSITAQDAEWCGMNGKQSTVSLYNDSGDVRATEQYLWGKRHGLSRKLDTKTGKPREEEKYEHGKLLRDGEKLYTKDGDLAVKTDCDDARVSCSETTFFEGGTQVDTLTVWKKGRLEQRTSHYQNGKTREALKSEKDGYRITRFDDEGGKRSDGTYMVAPSWSWDEYVPDGTLEQFSEGQLVRRAKYKGGLREGLSEVFFVQDGKRLRIEATFAKDKLTQQKLFVDDKLAAQLDYMPDGSLKSRKEFNLPKGIEI